ncbi:MAG: tRNA (adenosine(37)-N6)-dimethylallyltransferase MiaA [bacterium]|nr:tRNA (adenosine(37)-N6)-dimethylallyltransferase MiaA [bacterium]
MPKNTSNELLVIIGPTASGKTKAAIKLARKLKTEIISADSRQIYKGLDIGTAKATKKEMASVPHHCIDIVSPKKIFTANDFQKCADKAIKAIGKKSKIPIVVGGTGFYIEALLYEGSTASVDADWKLRARLEKKTTKQLVAQLKKLDPKRAKNIDQQNRRRLIRAIEIVKATGKPVPAIKRRVRYNYKIISLDPSPETLKKNITKRTRQMLKRGLLAEVKRVSKALSKKRMAELGFEYKYPALYLAGEISKTEMIEKINTENWRYAKRQLTWFKKYLTH